jgi:hypothetical protein
MVWGFHGRNFSCTHLLCLFFPLYYPSWSWRRDRVRTATNRRLWASRGLRHRRPAHVLSYPFFCAGRSVSVVASGFGNGSRVSCLPRASVISTAQIWSVVWVFFERKMWYFIDQMTSLILLPGSSPGSHRLKADYKLKAPRNEPIYILPHSNYELNKFNKHDLKSR